MGGGGHGSDVVQLERSGSPKTGRAARLNQRGGASKPASDTFVKRAESQVLVAYAWRHGILGSDLYNKDSY